MVEWMESVGSTVLRGLSAEEKRRVSGNRPIGWGLASENLCPPDKALLSAP